MAEKNHYHRWELLERPNKLQCIKDHCNTVTTVEELIKNTAETADKSARIQLLSKQLFAKELKKPAHDEAYAWVRRNAPAGTLKQQNSLQGVLL